MHRAIHGIESNWFRYLGPLYRFYRRHHLQHHHQPRTNFGTLFPVTDYVFFTWGTSGRRVEQAKLDSGCKLGKQCEVDATPVPGGTQGM